MERCIHDDHDDDTVDDIEPDDIGGFSWGQGVIPPNFAPNKFQERPPAALECKKTFYRPELLPDPAGEAYSTPQTPSLWRGPGCPSPRTPPRASPLTRNRRLGPSQHDGLDAPPPDDSTQRDKLARSRRPYHCMVWTMTDSFEIACTAWRDVGGRRGMQRLRQAGSARRSNDVVRTNLHDDDDDNDDIGGDDVARDQRTRVIHTTTLCGRLVSRLCSMGPDD